MGVFDRLFSRTTKTISGPMTDEKATKIISAYGKMLADRKSSFGDVSELPYAKERIKEALIHGIRTASDPKVRDLLKAGYITLAEFQPGFGNRRSAELTADDLKHKDPKTLAARILAKGDDFLKVPEEIAAEAALLMADLEALERVTADANVAVLAKKIAAEHMAVEFLRAEPSMAPGLGAKLRAKMASDVPEVFLRVQELSAQKK